MNKNHLRTLRRSIVSVPALFVLAAACSSGEHPTNFETTRVMHEGIQGGHADSTDTGVVMIYIDTGGGMVGSCTGSLIAPNVVLTARHCVASTPETSINCNTTQFGSVYPASSFYVFNDQTVTQQSFAYSVSQVRVPPNTTLMCGNDVAMLVLSQKVNSTKAKFLEPRLSQTTYGQEVYSAVGYGKTCPSCDDGGEARNRRDNLQVTCVGSSCGWGSQYLTDKEWAGDDGVCSGDSGGPALDSQGRIIGIASRGGEANGLCVQSMYERVNSWKDFITTVTIEAANAGGYTPPTWTGSTGTGGSGGAAQTCDACTSQVIVPGEACETSWASCINNTDCVAFLECLNGCSDATCQNKCVSDHATGVGLYGKVIDCMCTPAACETSCVDMCSGPACGFSISNAACNTCFETQCCDKGKKCADNSTCVALVQCLNACNDNDQTCYNACGTNNSGGVADYNAMIDCMSGPCAGSCGGGSAGSGGSGGAAGAAGSSQGGAAGSAQGGAAGSQAGGAAGSSAGGNPQGGAAGEGGEAGETGEGGDGGEDPGTDPPAETSTGSDSGCTASSQDAGSPAAWTALLAGLALLSSRRRRS